MISNIPKIILQGIYNFITNLTPFEIYDYSFFIIFCILVFIFLRKNRKNLKREMGIMFLYRTQVGVKLINYIGEKYKRTLNFLKYVIIAVGYFLMAGIIYLIGKSVILYVTHPILVTRIVKAPPLAPVIPYFPQIFGMQSFFPDFAFTHFILALSIVAIVHEFAHGIYMKFNKVRIKSTGIVFLGPILGAFVEQDEKQMEKKGKVAQMSILGAGVFANIVVAGIFFLMWWGLFYVSFIPSGTTFDMYMGEMVNVSSITFFGGVYLNNPTNQELIGLIDKGNLTNDLVLLNNSENSVKLTKIKAGNKSYYMSLDTLKKQLETNESEIGLYSDLPAINTGLRGTIISIDDKTIKRYSDFSKIIKNYKPGDKIKIETRYKDKILEYEINLAEDSQKPGRAVIGVANRNVRINIADSFAIFKQSFTEYKENGSLLPFLYFLVFWIFIINLLVGFFNMLPVSILDGGRFFYLTIWGLTKKEKLAKKVYVWTGKIILLAFALMMIAWLFGTIFR